MSLLHIADAHIDSPLLGLARYEGAPDVRLATRQAFSRAVDLALDEQVDAVVVAGDLYDGDWRDYNTGLFVCSEFSRLREGGIPVVVIAGNHDAASVLTKSLRLPENVTMLR